MVGSSWLSMKSKKGTPATPAAQRSGNCVTAAIVWKPPQLRPVIAIRAGSQPCRTRNSCAAATSSTSPSPMSQRLASCQRRP